MSSGEADYLRTVGRFDSWPWHGTHKFKLIDQASGECEFCSASPGTDKARKECENNPYTTRTIPVVQPACNCMDPAALVSSCPVHPISTRRTSPPELFPGDRKAYPVFTGLVMYFPDACAAVANCSHVANEQHNPGEPLRWAREKSIGEGNELLRHLMQAGTFDADGIRHSAKVAWRALELLQREIEAERK